jgi:hypothetical protein
MHQRYRQSQPLTTLWRLLPDPTRTPYPGRQLNVAFCTPADMRNDRFTFTYKTNMN